MSTHEAALAGSTGLVGFQILSTLTSHPSITKIHAYTRKPLPTSPKTHALQSTDTSTWPSLYPSSVPLFFSGLGTTRGTAGSFAAQYKIDHDLNIALAKGAAERGCKTYILISSGGANAKSFFGYPRMKGEIEEAVQQMGFEHVVILRPGLLVGDRSGSARSEEFAEGVLRKIAGAAGGVANGLKDFWAQDADVIARAAVSAGLQCIEGKIDRKVWVLGQSDIVRMGRTEWNANKS